MRIGLISGIAVFLVSTASVAADPVVMIDRIEIDGVTVFPTEEVESALEVAPGERLERIKVVRTAENLQALYRVKGYEQTTIKTHISQKKSEAVLEFSIVEGKPTRIAAIQFTPESIRDEAFQKHWRGIESALIEKIGLKPGDIFDQERIAAGKRLLQDLLASEEFVGARVDDVRISGAPEPTREGLEPAARWVSLNIHVDLGDRVTFGFRGNKAFATGHLLSLVDEQRVIGFGKDYIGAIRSRLEEEYRNSGYGNVRIQTYTIERPERQERHVTFAIQEGPRIRIGSITFDGNSVFESDELEDRFYESASTIIRSRYYSQREVQKAAELVVEWMKSKGYLGAKLITINASGAEGRSVRNLSPAQHLVIYVYEGDQTTVESVKVNGAAQVPEGEIIDALGARVGEPLNLFSLSSGIEAVKAMYRSRGFLNARILNEEPGVGNDVVKYSDENRLAAILLDIDEGPQFRAGKITIEGLVKTREEVARREIAIQEGDVLDENLLIQSEARLRRLGIFSVVTLRVQDEAERTNFKSIRVSLQEGTPGIVAGGVGFRNDLGIRLFGQVGYTNLGGKNQTVSLNAAVNRRFEDFEFTEYTAQLGYTWPWFFLGETTFRPALEVSAVQYRRFDAQTVSLTSTWERRLFLRPNISFIFTHALERIEQFDAPDLDGSPNPDNQTITLGSVTPTLRLDTRDDPLSPTAGLFATTSLEVASPYLGSQFDPFPVGFARFLVRADYFLPVSRNISWFFSFRSGFARSTQNPVLDQVTGKEDRRSGAIPLIRQFALGGAGSIRGYEEQELNKYDAIIRGTLAYVNYRTQLDLPFVGALRFGPFVDAANLLVDNFSFGGLDYGAGFGFHYQTPVGPVNLDWGFKLHPNPGDDPYRIYFSVGVI